MSQRQEYLVDVAEIGAGILDDATQIFEGLALRLENLSDTPVQWQSTQVETPRDPDATEIRSKAFRMNRGWESND